MVVSTRSLPNLCGYPLRNNAFLVSLPNKYYLTVCLLNLTLYQRSRNYTFGNGRANKEIHT